MATRQRTTDKPMRGHPRRREHGDAATRPLVTCTPGAPEMPKAWRRSDAPTGLTSTPGALEVPRAWRRKGLGQPINHRSAESMAMQATQAIQFSIDQTCFREEGAVHVLQDCRNLPKIDIPARVPTELIFCLSPAPPNVLPNQAVLVSPCATEVQRAGGCFTTLLSAQNQAASSSCARTAFNSG